MTMTMSPFFLTFFIVGLLLPSVYGTSPAQEDKMTKCTGPAQGRGFNNQFQFMKNNSVKAAVFQGCVRQTSLVMESLKAYCHSIGINN